MNFLKYTKIYFALAIIAVGLSLYAIFAFGLNMGIDFEGGSSINVSYKNDRPGTEQIKSALSGIEEMNGVQIQPMGQKEVVLKVNKKDISSSVYQNVITQLATTGEIDENSASIETISPLIGKELKDKTVIVVVVALLAMLAYIALAFRNVGKPISSFQYGFSSTLMLFHDVIIPLGVLAVMGKYFGAQLSIPVITALLTVVGYCINNTVVVFDRVRENLQKDRKSSYDEIVNKSLNETITRCINTSLTVIIALIPLYYFFSNEESLKYFAITMGTGVIVGIFSSVFLASPLLVAWNNYRQKKRGK
ncbi:MAG: protein translocase subunit SecF [Candidatus Pacebacteria bacterium]|nr:protein translocase subunit SecF [Candidatus Paceibacterota bacterium]